MDFALANRKELLIDSYQLQQKELAVKNAKAGYLPTVDLSLGQAGTSRFCQMETIMNIALPLVLAGIF